MAWEERVSAERNWPHVLAMADAYTDEAGLPLPPQAVLDLYGGSLERAYDDNDEDDWKNGETTYGLTELYAWVAAVVVGAVPRAPPPKNLRTRLLGKSWTFFAGIGGDSWGVSQRNDKRLEEIYENDGKGAGRTAERIVHAWTSAPFALVARRSRTVARAQCYFSALYEYKSFEDFRRRLVRDLREALKLCTNAVLCDAPACEAKRSRVDG